MNSRVAQLEALLERVQSRAAQPRPVTAVAGTVAAASAPVLDLSEAPDLETPALGLAKVASKELDSRPGLEAEETEAAAESLAHPVLNLAAAATDPLTPDLDEPGSELSAAGNEAIEDVDEDLIEFGEPVEELEDPVEEIEDLDLDLDDPLPESGEVSSPSSGLSLDEAPITAPSESTLSAPTKPREVGPTLEQVGQTVELEEGEGAQLELDEPALPEQEAAAEGRLKAEIPASAPSTPAQLPDDAREELERHRLGEEAPLHARTSLRPVLSTKVVDLLSAAKDFRPKSFAELLDASLGL